MISKVGRGAAAHLICSDCGLPLRERVRNLRASPIGQLVSWLLMGSFVLTAVGLMAIKDQQSPSLLDEQGMDLNQNKDEKSQERRRWVLVPGTPGSTLR